MFARNLLRPTLATSVFARRTVATLKEGDKVPQVVFKARVRDESIGGENPFTWKDVTTKDLFENKRIVLFGLPGGMIYISFLFYYYFLIYSIFYSFHSNLLLYSSSWI